MLPMINFLMISLVMTSTNELFFLNPMSYTTIGDLYVKHFYITIVAVT